MLDRIVHEIGHGIKDQITIADHQHLTITDNGETGAVLFGRCVVQLDNLTRDFNQIPRSGTPPFVPGSLFVHPGERCEYPQDSIKVGDRVAYH